MIIGFLGKGGSGKSTLSTALVEYMHSTGATVLALDADYNMDLSYNLGVPEDVEYLGTQAKHDLKFTLEADQHKKYADIVLEKTDTQFFALNPIDSFTQKYTKEIRPNLFAMSIGPQPREVMTDKICSHGMGGLLKAYLPLLKLNENEHVILDEKAGADGASTGIPTGMDFAVIVVEPTPHGIKAGKQIAEILEHYKTPYGFVLNKVKDTIETDLDPIVLVPFGQEIDSEIMKSLFDYIEKYHKKHGDTRLERSRAKFMYNKSI